MLISLDFDLDRFKSPFRANKLVYYNRIIHFGAYKLVHYNTTNNFGHLMTTKAAKVHKTLL